MKKWWLMIVLVMLWGCGAEKDDYAKYYPDLLPDEEDDFALQVIADEVTHERLEEYEIRNINPITNTDAHEDFNQTYPNIDVDEVPAYLLFDDDGLAFRTNQFDELIAFLRSNETK